MTGSQKVAGGAEAGTTPRPSETATPCVRARRALPRRSQAHGDRLDGPVQKLRLHGGCPVARFCRTRSYAYATGVSGLLCHAYATPVAEGVA